MERAERNKKGMDARSGGVKFINRYIILKVKTKIENQNLKELINIKIVLVKGTPKGKSLIKLKRTKIALVYCKPNLKVFDFEYKISKYKLNLKLKLILINNLTLFYHLFIS